MKQSLTLKLGQQLTMTPQLQQAIKLLQLSTLDLQLEIQQAVESNPMLEVDDGEEGRDQDLEEPSETALDTLVDSTDSGQQFEQDADLKLDNQQEVIPEELPVDSSWDDVYQPATNSSVSVSEGYDPSDNRSGTETLQDHLVWQLNLTPMSETDRQIGAAIIDAVNSDGIMTVSLEDLQSSLDDNLEIDLDEIEAVLHRIQQFDPPGVAARDLRECLLIQLAQLPDDQAWIVEARKLVDQFLVILASHDFNTLKRKMRLSEEALTSVVHIIQSLNPRPGSSLAASDTEYITPDVYVKREKGRWIVELSPEANPRIRINSDYAKLVRRADNSSDNNFLKNNLQEARWFLKSLESRNETLLKVATKIVEHQRGFLEYGEEAMKPLVLHDIADAVEMHESTISRVTTRKYMHTPRGIFELKYFFSSHVSTKTGGEVSSTAIRALIKKLTNDENPKKPLSDSKIAAVLADQNIKVARRTIAKYRESLSIPPSNERKRLV